MLQQNPNWTILIAGHTDNIGGVDYNQRLSEQRAASVRQALISTEWRPPLAINRARHVQTEG